MSLFFDNARVNANRPVQPVVRGTKRALENRNVNSTATNSGKGFRDAASRGNYQAFLDLIAPAAPDVGPLVPFTPAGASGAGSTATAAGNPFPVGPAEVPLDALMRLNEMQRSAAASWQDAINRKNDGTDRADADRALLLQRINRQMGIANRDARAGLGGRGMALSPSAMGRAARQLADAKASQQASVLADRARIVDQLVAAETAAALNSKRVQASVEDQRAAYEGDPNALMRLAGGN